MDERGFAASAEIVDREGMPIGTLLSWAESAGEDVLVARAVDGQELHIPLRHVDQARSAHERIVIDLDAGSSAGMTLPLAEEQLDVRTRQVERGRVIVRKRVETMPEERIVDLTREDVEVHRVPVNEIVEALPQVRREGNTTIIPVVEEVLVVEKRFRLVEEVRVTSTLTSEQHTVREDVRREVVDIEEMPPGDDDSR